MTRRLHRALLLVAGLLAACGGSGPPPSPTPQSVTSVLEALVLRGATIRQAVSGEAGCPSVTALQGNALRLVLTLPGNSEEKEIYLFRWRRPAQYDEAATEFEECLTEYSAASPRVEVQSVELSPWRAFGPDWSAELRRTVEESLRAAGGG